MANIESQVGFDERQFNTLAERGTVLLQKSSKQRQIVVAGLGTDMSKSMQLNGWAKRKIITQTMILALVDVARQKKALEREKQYWNTYHCLNKAQSYGGRLYGSYCKNRFCTLCLCIRKADILNRYLPVLKQWNEAYFVTITVKSIPAYSLQCIIDYLIKGIQRIIDKYRKRNQRGKGIKLIGIRSLECNFNPMKRTYNPHFHIIVPSEEIANIIVMEWLKLWKHTGKTTWTYKGGQKIIKISNMEKCLIETVKYGSKIFTEQDVMKKSKSNNNASIYVSALDNIIAAMKGHRIFERFGFDLPESDNSRPPLFSALHEYDEWVFDLHHSDWINPETEEVLAGYELPNDLNEILKNKLDISLQ